MAPLEGVPLLRPFEPAQTSLPELAPQQATPGSIPFGEMLEHAVSSANASSQVASASAEAFAAGRRDDIHGTMLSLSQADIELRMVGNVRNKIIDAFYELWRMQI